MDAAVEALREGHTHYVPAPGIPPLREAVAAFLESNGRMETTPDRVIVTPGAKPIMFFTILALANEGDEVLYPDPGFPMYESITSFVGAVPVPVPLRESNGFRIDTDELAGLITDRTKLLIINSPHNPCGSALTREDCEAIADLAHPTRPDRAQRRGVLGDQVRRGQRARAPYASVLDVDGMADRTILLDGWSKTFAMTGWRLGFGVFPPALVEPVTRLAINSVSCTSAFSQYAAIAALEGPWQPVDDMVAEFRRRRDVIVSGLNDIPGISCLEPQGAFYVFPNITGSRADLCRTAGHAARRRAAWPPCPAPPSASTARATCASPTRTRWRTSRPRWMPSGRSSPRTRKPASDLLVLVVVRAEELHGRCAHRQVARLDPLLRAWGRAFGLIFTYGGNCGSDHTTCCVCL